MRVTKQKTTRPTATFIVRILGTESGDWRGQVDHVQSGQSLRFKYGIQALRFMDQQVQASGEMTGPMSCSEASRGSGKTRA